MQSLSTLRKVSTWTFAWCNLSEYVILFLWLQFCVANASRAAGANEGTPRALQKRGAADAAAKMGAGFLGAKIGVAEANAAINAANGGSTPKPLPTCVPKQCINDDPPPEPLCTPFMNKNLTGKEKFMKNLAANANCAFLGVSLALGDFVGVALGVLRVLGFPIPRALDMAKEVMGAAVACHINGTHPNQTTPEGGKQRRDVDSFDWYSSHERHHGLFIRETKLSAFMEHLREKRFGLKKLVKKVDEAKDKAVDKAKDVGKGVAHAAEKTAHVAVQAAIIAGNATKEAAVATGHGIEKVGKVVAEVAKDPGKIKDDLKCLKAKAVLQAKSMAMAVFSRNFTKNIIQATKHLGKEVANDYKLNRKSMGPIKALGYALRNLCGKIGAQSGIFKRSVDGQRINGTDSTLVINKRGLAATFGGSLVKGGLKVAGAGQGNLTICGEDGTTEPPPQ